MTAKLRKLLEERHGLMADLQDLIRGAESRNGKWTDEERARFDETELRVDRLDLDIRAERDAIEQGIAEAAGSPALGPDGRRSLDYDEDGVVQGQALARGQSFESYVRARGLVDGDERRMASRMSFDRMIRGLATGMWDGAEAEKRAMNEGTGSAGGNLVPTLLAAQIVDLARARSTVLAAGGQLVPMESNKVDIPKWVGDPTAAWRNEAASITASDGTLSKLTLTAQSLSALVIVSRELLEDAPGVQAKLADAFAQSFALKVDLAALRGTGTAPEPRGVKNTSGITTTSLGTNGATPTWDNIVDNIGVLEDLNETPNAMISAPRTWRSLAKAKDTTNQYIAPPAKAGLPQYGSTQIPVNLTQGTSSDTSELYIGDWSQVFVGVRTQLEILVLRERYADTGQVGFVCWWRGDIGVARPAAFNVVTGVRP